MAKAPTKISYKKLENALEIEWVDKVYSLPIELLRVRSPSADTGGRHGRRGKPQSGKKDVRIKDINESRLPRLEVKHWNPKQS